MEDQSLAEVAPEQDENVLPPTESDPNAESQVDQQQVVEDEEEVEYEGKKFRAPKGVGEALMRQADYTRKTQEVAEARRQLEERAGSFQSLAQANHEVLESVGQVHALNARLKEFEGVNWDELIDTDPVKALRLQQSHRQLEMQRNEAQQRAQAAIHKAQQHEHAQRVQAEQRAHEELTRSIKGWGPEMQAKLADYARKELGYSAQRLASITEAAEVKAIHKAWLADQTQRNTPKEPIKPAAKVSGSNAAATTDPDKLSPEDWLRWRNKQLRNR